MDTCRHTQTLVGFNPAMGGCGGAGCSTSSDGDEKSSGSVEEEEEDDLETTMVMTCEGNISDPQLHSKLSCLMHRLQHLTNSERVLEVIGVEPWNSVRVTFSIPREAARRLSLLAQAGEPALRHLGILSVQVQGDQVVSLRLAGSNNECNEVVLRPTDGPISSGASALMDRFIGPPTGAASGGVPQQQHQYHHHHHLQQQQQQAPVQQFRQPAPQSLPGFPYSQQPQQGPSNVITPQQQQPPHGAMVVRSNSLPAQPLLHYRPNYASNQPPPPPYSEQHHHSPNSLVVQTSQPFVVQGGDGLATPASPAPGTYRLTPTSGLVSQQPGAMVAAVATGRQVIVRPPPTPPHQQQLLQQQPAGAAPQLSSAVTTVGNVVKNSPLLVGLLQQPEQQVKSPGIGSGGQELGLASTHLTSLAANHYTANHSPAAAHHHHHRQLVSSSTINQYSSSTRSKDGLTTHQQVYSGGSVITNARVPVAGGLQQHPQATGKPPPLGGLSAQSPISSAVVQQTLPPPVVSAGPARLATIQHHSQQVVHNSSVVASPAGLTSVGGMQQASVLPQRSASGSITNNATAGLLPGAAPAASPSPAISPTPSLPSPHPSAHTSLPPSTVVSQTQSATATSVSVMSAFANSHVNALTPPLTPSNQQQVLSIGSSSVQGMTGAIPSLAGSLVSCSDGVMPVSSFEDHSVVSSSYLTQTIVTSQGDSKTISSKVPSPKMVTSKESQYLINPNTGLLEPRHNTDSSDSEPDVRPSSPPQLKVSQSVHYLQAQPKPTTGSLHVKNQQHQPESLPQSSKSSPLHEIRPQSVVSASLEEVSNPRPGTPTAASVAENVTERPRSRENVPSLATTNNNSHNSAVGGKEVTPIGPADPHRLVPCASMVQQDRGTGVGSSSTKAKDDSGSSANASNWEKSNRIVRAPGSGELRLKLKLGREHTSQKTIISPNTTKKSDKKDALSGSSSGGQSSCEQRVVPKLHIKISSAAPVIVKPPEEKERSRRISDKGREDRKRKGNRKRSRNSDCESDRLEVLKLKQSSAESQVLKISDLKKAKLEHESEESSGYRSKDSSDSRSKGPRTFEDKYSNKVDSVKLAKFEAKLRTRPKAKTPLRKLGGLNNIGELTSHKILETLPPSITKVAAMHTQQPHRNPTSSSLLCSSSSYFGSGSSTDTMSSLLDRDVLLHDSLGSTLSSSSSSSSSNSTTTIKSGLMNGDLSHAERGALSRSLQSSTFSELTAGGKLTIRRKASSTDHHHLRTSSSGSSLSLLKKEAPADAKRKMGGLSCIPTYLNSSVLINKVSSLNSSSSGYSRLHDSDRGRHGSSSSSVGGGGGGGSANSKSSSGSSGGGGGSVTKGGELLKTALCANFPSLNANSDITIQSVRKKDLLYTRLAGGGVVGSEQGGIRGAHHKGPSASLTEGLNKAGRVTCIDVTDRKAVEEAVKFSRNSSSNTDSQQKIADKLERWNCSSATVVSAASSSHGSSSSVLPTNNNTNHLATILQPDSTNYFPTSLRVESNDASDDVSSGGGGVGSKSASSSQGPPVEQDLRDSHTGNLKSHVKSSSLVANASNCDTRVKGEPTSSVSVATAEIEASSAPGEEYSGKVEAGSGSSGGGNTTVASIKATLLGGTSEVVESPESTPKGEHGTGQGGEDSGIESMDALSEKSPNQSDQSPHRRDEKECETFGTSSGDVGGCKAGAAAPCAKMASTNTSCNSSATTDTAVSSCNTSNTTVSSSLATSETCVVTASTTVAASSITMTSKSSLSADINGSVRQRQFTTADMEGSSVVRLQESQPLDAERREDQLASSGSSDLSRLTTAAIQTNDCDDVYKYDIEKEAPENILSHVSLKDREGRHHSEESHHNEMKTSSKLIDKNSIQTEIGTKSNPPLLQVKYDDLNFPDLSDSLCNPSTAKENSSSITKPVSVSSSFPSTDVTVTSKRHDGAITLTPSGKDSSKKSAQLASTKFGTRLNCMDKLDENGLPPHSSENSRTSPSNAANSNANLSHSNSSLDYHEATKRALHGTSQDTVSASLAGGGQNVTLSTITNNSNTNCSTVSSLAAEPFAVVNSSSGSGGGGSTAMIFLSTTTGTSGPSSAVSTAKVVTLKSSSFSSSSSSGASITPPVGKAFRLVSLPENMSVSPASSPVKGQLVTFKQLVASSGGTIRSSSSTVLTATGAAQQLMAAKLDDSPPSLLKAQLLAPPSNAHHNYTNTYVTNPVPVSSTNGELDFVGFSPSSIIRIQSNITKISQIITPEKDQKNNEILSPTEDEPKPLRVQPPLYTYGSNKDRKKDLDTEPDDKDKGKTSPAVTPEKDICNNLGIKLETNPREKLERSANDHSTKMKPNDRGFDILTIEIPSTNSELLDDKRLTRATRQSARLASPKVNSPSCELSPRAPPADRKSPSLGYATLNSSGLGGQFPAASNSANTSISALANTAVTFSGRVLANSGSLTVTSVSSLGVSGLVIPTTRGAKRRRHEPSEISAASLGCDDSSSSSSTDAAATAATVPPPAKMLRRKPPTVDHHHHQLQQQQQQQQLTTDQRNRLHNTRNRDTDTPVRYGGCESSDDEEGDHSGDGAAGSSGVVVIGVASCLAAAAAAASSSSTTSGGGRRRNPSSTTTAAAAASTSAAEEDDEARPSSRSSRTSSGSRRSRERTATAPAAAVVTTVAVHQSPTATSAPTTTTPVCSSASSQLPGHNASRPRTPLQSDALIPPNTTNSSNDCSSNHSSSCNNNTSRPNTPTRRGVAGARIAPVTRSTLDDANTYTNNKNPVNTNTYSSSITGNNVCTNSKNDEHSSVSMLSSVTGDSDPTTKVGSMNFATNSDLVDDGDGNNHHHDTKSSVPCHASASEPPSTNITSSYCSTSSDGTGPDAVVEGSPATSVGGTKGENESSALGLSPAIRETRGGTHSSKTKATPSSNTINNNITTLPAVAAPFPPSTTTSAASSVAVTATIAAKSSSYVTAANNNNNTKPEDAEVLAAGAALPAATSGSLADNRRKTRSAAAAPEDPPNKRRRISKDK